MVCFDTLFFGTSVLIPMEIEKTAVFPDALERKLVYAPNKQDTEMEGERERERNQSSTSLASQLSSMSLVVASARARGVWYSRPGSPCSPRRGELARVPHCGGREERRRHGSPRRYPALARAA